MKLALASVALIVTLVGLGVSLFQFLPPRPSELVDYERLWRAKDRLPHSLDELERLATRDDGVGWQARVLAGRGFLAQADYEAGTRYLAAALKLRSTSPLRAELARALEAAGRRTESLREWEKLLPASEAVQAIIRLEPDPERAARLLLQAGHYTEALAAIGSLETSSARLSRARALVGGEADLQLVAPLVVELDRSLGAVDLEGEEVVMTPGVARCLQTADRAR